MSELPDEVFDEIDECEVCGHVDEPQFFVACNDCGAPVCPDCTDCEGYCGWCVEYEGARPMTRPAWQRALRQIEAECEELHQCVLCGADKAGRQTHHANCPIVVLRRELERRERKPKDPKRCR